MINIFFYLRSEACRRELYEYNMDFDKQGTLAIVKFSQIKKVFNEHLKGGNQSSGKQLETGLRR